jgi:hypothetical protein
MFTLMTNTTIPLANGFELFVLEDESQRTDWGSGYWRVVLYAPNGVDKVPMTTAAHYHPEEVSVVTWAHVFADLTREAEAIAEAGGVPA